MQWLGVPESAHVAHFESPLIMIFSVRTFPPLTTFSRPVEQEKQLTICNTGNLSLVEFPQRNSLKTLDKSSCRYRLLYLKKQSEILYGLPVDDTKGR